MGVEGKENLKKGIKKSIFYFYMILTLITFYYFSSPEVIEKNMRFVLYIFGLNFSKLVVNKISIY